MGNQLNKSLQHLLSCELRTSVHHPMVETVQSSSLSPNRIFSNRSALWKTLGILFLAVLRLCRIMTDLHKGIFR